MYNIFFSKIELGFPLVEKRLKQIISSNSKIVIIPWSFAMEIDDVQLDKYYMVKIKPKYVQSLLKLGIKEENISYLNCYRDTFDYMKDMINNSDVLVLTGGNPEMLYEKVKYCGLLEIIKNYDRIVIGSSAGAELQLRDYFITAKNNYYKKFDWYEGFDILDNPFYIDVHSIDDEDYLEQFKKIAKNKRKKVYAIFDDGAIIYNRKFKEIEVFGQVLTFDYEN